MADKQKIQDSKNQQENQKDNENGNGTGEKDIIHTSLLKGRLKIK